MKPRRGIILAGGAGSRLHPLTIAVSKQLLPVYNKPMIYYPLSALMLAEVREILIITAPDQADGFKRLLGDGARLGLSIQYAVQEAPAGLPQAYTIGEDFVAGEASVLVLGDNIFYGSGFIGQLGAARDQESGCTVFGYPVADPSRYGVVAFEPGGKVSSLEEKPARPKSNVAVTGLYFFDGRAPEFAHQLKPSARGELEILDLVARYLELGELNVQLLGRGFAWLDTGTHDALIQAGEYVRTIEERQGLRIGCIEEIAFLNGWIDKAALLKMAAETGPYGAYLKALAEAPRT